jgi:hypothetical protein
MDYKELLPFFDLMEYRSVEDERATIRINVKDSTLLYFEYGPKWVSEIHRDILLNLMLVEAMKIVLHHPTRLHGIHGDIQAKISASNVVASMDISINAKLDKLLQNLEWFNKVTGKNIEKNKLSFEVAYRYLNEVNKKNKAKQIQQFASQSQSNSNSNQKGQSSNQSQQSSAQSQNNSNSSQSQSQNGSNNSKDQSGKGQQNQNDTGSSQNGQNNNPNQQNSENQGQGQRTQRELVEQHYSPKTQAWQNEGYAENLIVDDTITREFEANGGIDAFNGNGHNCGNKYSEITKKMLFDANTYDFNVKKILNRFAADVRTQFVVSSRMRYNRRYGLERPGYAHTYKSKVGICYDRSGSMDNKKDVELAVGIINSALKYSEVWYCEWNTQCTGFTKIKTNFNNVAKEGGGTDPQCVIDYIKEHKLRFDGLIFITDNFYCWNKPNLCSKISILGTADSCQPPAWCKYFMKMKDLIK